jgi:hypothetical protein
MEDKPKFEFQFSEEENLNKIKEFIESTYTSENHYVGDRDGTRRIQVQEFMASIGIVKPFCVGNVIKYASRFGKKDGYNKKDLYKAVHYLIILLHYIEKEEQNEETESV